MKVRLIKSHLRNRNIVSMPIKLGKGKLRSIVCMWTIRPYGASSVTDPSKKYIILVGRKIKRFMVVLLSLVMVLGISVSAFAGTITAPETVFEGEDFTVTLLDDNAGSHNAKVVWTSSYTVTNPTVGEYTFDAVINKYRNNGDLQATEDSEAVVTEVVAPVIAPVGFRVAENAFDWNTPGKSSNSQLIIGTIELLDANGKVVDTVEWNYTIGEFKTQSIELLGARNLIYTTADGTVLTLHP